MSNPAGKHIVRSHRRHTALRPLRAARVVFVLALAVCSLMPRNLAAQAQAPASATAAAGGDVLPAGPLTLEQVLAVAEARSETVAIAEVALERNAGDQVRAQAALLPQLSASATYDRSLANEFQGVFDNIDFGGGRWRRQR